MNVIYEDIQQGSLKPENLIQFTNQHLKDLIILKEMVAEHHKNKTTASIFLKRLDLRNEQFSTQIVHGKVIEINNGTHFTVATDYLETLGGGKTVISNNLVIRLDSFLGNIPVLNADSIPCETNHTLHEGYAAFISQATNEMKKFEGKKKKVIVMYKNFELAGANDYYFCGNVLKVNRSNVEVRIDYSHGTGEGGSYYYNSIPHNGVRPFITPKTMLIGVRA